MLAIEQEQQIISEELKFDKKLKLSNGSQGKDNDSKEDDKDDGFKKIIKESIQSAENLKEKLGVKEISYPNDYVFASLANRAYEERENVKRTKDLYGKKLDQALGNWQLLTVAENTDNFNGYVGAAYWNPDTQQIIISHRGTELKDFSTILGTLFTDVKGIFFNQHAPQINSAVTFTDEIISVLKEINRESRREGKKEPHIQLFFTGHSLGGWLAQITTFTAKYLIKDGNNFVKNGNFEETGYHASAVIFDSPGGRDMLVRIRDKLMNLYRPSLIDSLDITSYLSAPNLINACRSQLGEVYRIRTILSEADKQWMKEGLAGYLRLMHRRGKFKEVFDPETGEIREDEEGKLRIEKVHDWPLLVLESEADEALKQKGIVWGVGKLASLFLPGFVVMLGEYGYPMYTRYNELNQELNKFFTLANEDNSYHLDEESIRVQVDHRIIRYRTEKLDKNYKNERSLNVFTQPERKFLEEYKFLERYQEDLQGIVTLEELFDSFKDDKKLISDIMEMLKGCTVESGIIRSENLQKFVPYIKRVLHFFPGMKQKVAEAYYKLPSEIHNKLYQLISSSYLNAIENSLDCGKDNFGFKVFLEDSNLKILHTVQSCTSLGATRVYKTFNLVRNNYGNEKYHAFLNLDRIFYLGGEIFISFLKKIDYRYLLVIECDDVLNDKIKEFLEKLFSALEDNRNIKVILATEKGSDLSKFINEYVVNNPSKCREENSEVKWNDLTPDSQKKLLEKTVIFQGKEVPLNIVVNGSDALNTIIDPETIVELFKNKKIEIGKPLPSLGETEGYYIERKLVKKVKVKEEVLKDDNLTDLFAVSNISKEELSRLAGGRKVRSFNEEDPNPVRFITLNENAEENFQNLCDVYSDRTIHWLRKEEDGNLIWKKSHGKTLRRYIENYESDLPENEYSRDNTSIKIVEVNDISEFDEKLIVVAAEPGMGKTTVLTRLGTQEADDSKWLIRINLVEYKDKLEQEGFSDVVKFLHENNIVSNTLAKKLLESRLNNSGNIVFLLDGFDEITAEGQTNVINLIKKLQETQVEKILISTRLHLRNELENSLATVAYTFKPFSREDQAEFLKKFWQRNSGIDQGRLDNYINELLEFVSKSIGDKERKFMGIPMQMRMIAEAFQEVIKNQELLDHPERTFPKDFDILKLYDRFLYAKYRVYFGKRGAENIDLDYENEDWLTIQPTKIHRSLALKVLFPEMEKDFIGNNLPSEKDKQKVNQAGIAQCINDRVVFTHRTFAEYFVAGFLADKLSRGKDSKKYETIIEFLARELFESKNEVIKTFLDYRLAKHAAILKGKLDIIRKNVSITDALGRGALHYAAQEGHKEIVDALINNGADIRKSDELGKTALHYAARYNGGPQVVNCLLENAKDCINNKDKNGRTAVYYAAQQGNWEIVDVLIKKGADTSVLDQKVLVFHYTYQNNLELVKTLVKQGVDIATKDNHGNTLLHIAAQKGHLTIVEFLLEKGADVGIANSSGKRPISYAAEGNHWNVVESLLRKNAKFNDLSGEQKLSLLDHSAKNTHWDIVKLFIEDNDRDNYFSHLDGQQKVELLCSLVRSKDLSVAKFLIEKGTEINGSDSNGKRPISYAAKGKHWNIVESLLRKGATFNVLDNKQKLSLLRNFAKNAQWDIVKLFMKDNQNDDYFRHLRNQQKVKLLCYLIDSGELGIAKFLIEKGIEVNSPDSNGKRLVSYAAKGKHWSIVESLLRRKAKFNDLSGEQKGVLLDHSAKSAHWDIVKLFIEDNDRGNYFSHLDGQQKVELLCFLIRSKDLGLAKFVIEKGTEINSPDSEGKKPIHYAAGNGHWNIVELLLRNNGKFSDLENTQKDSLLRYSIKSADWDIIKLFMEDDYKEDYFDQLDDRQRMCCLYHFISVGNVGITKFFIEQLIRKERISSVNVPNNHGETFLHLAAKNGKLGVVQYLVNEKGADLTITNTNRKTAKDLATEGNYASVVEFLEQAQQEKLFDSAKQGNLCTIRSLISQGANVDSRDHNNWTPLHFAAENGHLELVKYLLEKGANVLAKNDHDTVLHLAVSSDKEEIIKLVLDKIKETQRNINQHVDAQDTEGDTPLMWAAESGRVNAAKILLEYGASIEVKNNDGMTALHWTAKNGHLEVAKLLADNRDIIHAIDNSGRKPIHVAALHGHRNVMGLFLSREVSVDDTDQRWLDLFALCCL